MARLRVLVVLICCAGGFALMLRHHRAGPAPTAAAQEWSLPYTHAATPTALLSVAGRSAFLLQQQAGRSPDYTVTRVTLGKSAPETLYHGKDPAYALPFAFAVSPTGSRALISDSVGVTYLDLQSRPAAAGQLRNAYIRSAAWSPDGQRWVGEEGLYEVVPSAVHPRGPDLGASILVLYEGREAIRLKPMRSPSSLRAATQTLLAWPAPQPGAAYALMLDGQVWESTREESRPLFQFAPVRPTCVSAAGPVLFALDRDEVLRADLATRQVQRKSLYRVARVLGLKEALQPLCTVRAIDEDRVSLSIEPWSNRLGGGGAAETHAGGVYLFRFSTGALTRILELTPDRRLGATLDGSTYAVTKDGLWSMTYQDRASKSRLTYTPWPKL